VCGELEKGGARPLAIRGYGFGPGQPQPSLEREVEDGHGGRANSSTGGRISRKGREEVNDGSFFLLDEGGELGVN
jgi:hypothetical protein